MINLQMALCEQSASSFYFSSVQRALNFCADPTGAFHRIGRKGMTMKESIVGCFVYPVAYGALIGLTIGIADTFLKTPFNPYLFLTIW